MQERKRSPWLFAGLILILVLSLLFGYTGLSCIAGCINGETAYEVMVIGFENASIPQHLCIYLPLPLVNGESLFPDDFYQNKQFSGWESSVVETPRGKMLVFHTTSLPVQNLHARFQKTGILTHTLPNMHGDSSLTYAPSSAENLSVTLQYNAMDTYPHWGGPFPTYVYLPDSLCGMNVSSVEILTSAKVKRATEQFPMSSGMTYYLESHVIMPGENVSGWIPIPGFSRNVPWDRF